MNPYHTHDPIWRESTICRAKAAEVDAAEAPPAKAVKPKAKFCDYAPRVLNAVSEGCNTPELLREALPDLSRSQVANALRLLRGKREIVNSAEDGYRVANEVERIGVFGKILPQVLQAIAGGHSTREAVQQALPHLTQKQVGSSFSQLSAGGFIRKTSFGHWAAA